MIGMIPSRYGLAYVTGEPLSVVPGNEIISNIYKMI